MTGRTCGGSTPMISCGSPVSMMRWPIAEGLRPKRRFHNSSLMNTTRAAFGTSSCGEVAAKHGCGLQHGEVLVAHLLAVQRLGLGVAGERRTPSADRCHALEHCALGAPVDEVARRRPLVGGPAARTHVLPEHHQPIRGPVRQRPDQQRVDDGEDGGVGADAERDREDGDGAKRGRLDEGAEGVLPSGRSLTWGAERNQLAVSSVELTIRDCRV